MKTPNCKCLTCGKEYYFCPKCNSHKPSPAPLWRVNYCDENCKSLFDIVSSYNCGSLTDEQANAMLAKCDLSNLDKMKENIKTVVKSIQKKTAKASFSEPFKPERKEESSKGFSKPKREDKATE